MRAPFRARMMRGVVVAVTPVSPRAEVRDLDEVLPGPPLPARTFAFAVAWPMISRS